MTVHTITLEGTFAVSKGPRDKSWEPVSVTVDRAAIPADLLARLVDHAITQKVADAASSAKTPAEADGAMNKALKAIYAGEWSSRSSGEGLADIRSVAVHRLFKALLDGDDRKRFSKLSASDQVRKALENVEVFESDAIDAEVAKIEAERAARAEAEASRKEAVKGLAGKIKISF